MSRRFSLTALIGVTAVLAFLAAGCGGGGGGSNGGNVTALPAHTVWLAGSASISGNSLTVKTEPALVTGGVHVPLIMTVYVAPSAVTMLGMV